MGIGNARSTRASAFFYDVAMAFLAVVVAFLFRFGTFERFGSFSLFLSTVVPFTATAALSFLVMRTYRTSWRHASTADLVAIVQASTLATLLYLPLSFLATRLTEIPRTFVLMPWMMLILFMAGSRIGFRLWRERRLFFTRQPMLAGQTPILVVGGGTSADIFLRGLDGTSDYYPVGILSDSGLGSLLRGVPILGTTDNAEGVVAGFKDAGDRPRKFVVVDPSPPPGALERLLDVALRAGLTVARVPNLLQLRPGIDDIPELQPISVEDLLERPQIVLEDKPVLALVAGKRVLVTGAGGSIGSEIVRQVCAIGPAAVCLVDASELALYSVDLEMGERWPGLSRTARLVDVRHYESVRSIIDGFQPDILFHAAALKHVPLVEQNPLEGLWTNVVGSRHVADAALAGKVHTVVLISSDKAVNPTNIMGASKRCAESYCQALGQANAAHSDATRFVIVRFGNVLGSTGSVVPLFERQLKAGGPLTITDPDVTRFFMTIREAVQLVLQASALGATAKEMQGRVLVLDMGRPVKVLDLARKMIRLAGLRPEIDVAIKFTGLRQGEKMFEELFHDEETVQPTSISGINVATPRTLPLADLSEKFQRIERACLSGQSADAVAVLKVLVPELQISFR